MEMVLEVAGLCKEFPGVVALDDVDLSFHLGEIHSIIGENGAGKSTLMKVLAGIYQPDAGRLRCQGKELRWSGVPQAQAAGVVMMHQELNLVDELTVAANIALGRERSVVGILRQDEAREQARGLLQQLGSSIDVAARVGDLSVAQKQLVEIAKALSFNASVLILDEPTAVLSRQDTAALFRVMRQLRERNVCLIYISHILPEVLEISDRITVMRDGQVIKTLERAEFGEGRISETTLASLMVGRPMADHFPPRQPTGTDVGFCVRSLTSEAVRDVSFEVRRGEIFGLAGLVGAGRTELAEAIFGVRRRQRGAIEVEGMPVSISTPADAIASGIAYLSEDRKGIGLTLGMSVMHNITLVSLRRYTRGLISLARERTAAAAHMERLAIRAGDPGDMVDFLSGGNQQKVALARWLETAPKVLIVDEPTRGVDIGAKAEIYRLISELAERGVCCVMISSELNELLGLCHRIGVMRSGRLVAVVPGPGATEQQLMTHAAGVGVPEAL